MTAPADRPVALVTGASRRVGLAIARALARSGCDLVITGRDEARHEAAESLRAMGARVRVERLELDDVAAAATWADALARELPRLDVLVHNASEYESTPLDQLSASDAERAYRVNAASPLLISARLAPRLAQSPLPGGGAIIAMADMHAMGRPRRGFAAYSMSKAALVEMVRSLARDLAPRVRVNGVAPGVVAFPDQGPESQPEMQRAYLSRVPLARRGTPDDAAEVVRWLALDAAYITGEIIRCDGGRWLA